MQLLNEARDQSAHDRELREGTEGEVEKASFALASNNDRQAILVVEDSKFQRNTLCRQLHEWNYEVIEAVNGEEGLNLYKEHSPKVIITDLHMPRMDGFSLVRAVRNIELHYTYIIVISGLQDKESIVSALRAGADDYLTKPFHPGELEVRLYSAERILRLQSQDLLIFSLAQLADYRSKETGNHIRRVQHYVKIVAEDLARGPYPDLTRARISLLESMSCLHDIGKVAIPDYVLNKPGKLSKLEYSIMKKHTSIGGHLLQDIHQKVGGEQLKMATNIVLYHHERYDGTGYPEGLEGEEIPLSARIVALGDVFDALSSVRVYKEAFPRDKCRDIIVSERGKHFDPHVVDSFLKNEDRFWEIYKKFRD